MMGILLQGVNTAIFGLDLNEKSSRNKHQTQGGGGKKKGTLRGAVEYIQSQNCHLLKMRPLLAIGNVIENVKIYLYIVL